MLTSEKTIKWNDTEIYLIRFSKHQNPMGLHIAIPNFNALVNIMCTE
jgi:hypothetical protein